MDVVKPERLKELEERQGWLTTAEAIELENLQVAYASRLARPDEEPDGEHNPEQIAHGYRPHTVTKAEARRFAALKVQNGLDAKLVAKVYRVPYWLLNGEPRPSWLAHPIWRLRAWLWR